MNGFDKMAREIEAAEHFLVNLRTARKRFALALHVEEGWSYGRIARAAQVSRALAQQWCEDAAAGRLE